MILPVAPNLSEMSDAYLSFIEEVKAEIQKQRISVVLNANSSMICLYWNIGRAILKKQEEVRGKDTIISTEQSTTTVMTVTTDEELVIAMDTVRLS